MSDYEGSIEPAEAENMEGDFGSNSETRLNQLSLVSRLQLDDEESGLKDDYLDELKQCLQDGIDLDFSQLEYLHDRCDFLDEKQFCDLNNAKIN